MFGVDISVDRSVRSLMYRIYAWMSLGLGVTAAVSYWVSTMPAVQKFVFSNPWLFFGLLLLQIILVVSLIGALRNLSAPVAYMLFFAYAVATGLSTSAIFLFYSLPSIFITFLTTTGMFGVMALYGYFTRSDLSSMRNFLLMGLVGLILAGLVNMFLRSSQFDLIVAAFGVVIFSLLTAYDVQKIKILAQQMLIEGHATTKVALFGALMLYLDFINLFMYLLRFLGKKRND